MAVATALMKCPNAWSSSQSKIKITAFGWIEFLVASFRIGLFNFGK